jgi:hypothetical protein
VLVLCGLCPHDNSTPTSFVTAITVEPIHAGVPPPCDYNNDGDYSSKLVGTMHLETTVRL